MSGVNTPIFDIPPGVFSSLSQYATGKHWRTGNQIRWHNGTLGPVGGWRTLLTFTGVTTPVRKMFTWRDFLKQPWLAAGSSDKLIGASYDLATDTFTQYDITPAALGWIPATAFSGWGRGTWGSGYWGTDPTVFVLDDIGTWSMDNDGKDLVAVHSQDGRLVAWDPLTPATPAAQVPGSPASNTFVLVTNEEHVMVFGGRDTGVGTDNPRKVAWASRRTRTDWVASESNSAGGFDLQSNGSIVAAVKVQGGIVVITDTDVHLIEYVGPPNYYSRRKISDEGGIIGQNAITTLQGSAIWLDHANVCQYLGGTINKIPCSVHSELFHRSNMGLGSHFVLGNNEFAEEIWMLYPQKTSDANDVYVTMSYSDNPYWSMGAIPRTAWCAPVWQQQPLACNGAVLYEHEFKMTADGVSRSSEIFAETGAFELGDGDTTMRVDRIYNDVSREGDLGVGAHNDSFSLTFKLRQAPSAPERVIGPVMLTNPKGYTRVRMKARQFVFRVDQTFDRPWKMGKVRARIKPGGGR